VKTEPSEAGLLAKVDLDRLPRHIAIIMDGNGRWATARGWPRVAGHRAGADAVRRVLEAAPGLGIRTLTLYAFSSDNWQRPPAEVATLMRLFGQYLASETAKCVENGVRIHVVGRRDRLDPRLRRAIEAAETATAGGATLDVRIAVDYSARDAILRAARQLHAKDVSREAFSGLLGIPDVDLLIRTGGEQRLSDFLLWECAYAELCFTRCMWPDFAKADLETALAEFHARDRRFGRLKEAAVG
jgi:undecaprenyl diphosphate synthase